MWQKVVGLIAVWRLLFIALAAVATKFVPFVFAFTPKLSFGVGRPYLAWIWGNFDGMVFMLIAQSGYTAEQLPFFPLLPALIAVPSTIFGLNQLWSGLIVTTLAFLTAQYFLYRLLKLDKLVVHYWLFLLVLLLFPTSVFYASIYADGLFLSLASATLLYSRQRKWLLASVFGALAALARLNGIALITVIGVEYLLSLEPKLEKKWDFRLIWSTLLRALKVRKLWESGVLWSLLIPAAFLGYLAYIQLAFGDWYLFFSGVEVWHRNKLTFPLQTFWRYFKILVLYPNLTFTYLVAALEAVFTVLYILAMIWSWGKIRLSYWVMIFFHLLIPTLTGTLQGMPRYGLHLYPLFLIYMLFLRDKPKWVKGLWFGVSIGLLVFYAMYYTRGYFVA